MVEVIGIKVIFLYLFRDAENIILSFTNKDFIGAGIVYDKNDCNEGKCD